MANTKMFTVFGGVVAVFSVTLGGTFFLNLKQQRKISIFGIQFFLLFFTLLCLVSRIIWINVTLLFPGRRSTDSVFMRVILRLPYLFLAAFLGLANCSILIGRFIVGSEPSFISQLAFTCLGFVVLIFFNLCVFSLIGKCLTLCLNDIPTADKWKAMVSVALALFLCIHGLTTVSKGPAVVRVTVPLPKLPHSMNGTKIVQLSDIHLGPVIGKAALERVVNMVLVECPDIIVITGDLVDSAVLTLKSAVSPLKKLSSRYGAYFVTGNHEYFTGDADAWLNELEKLGIRPLHNSHVIISSKQNPSDKIYLAGVDDIVAYKMNYDNHGMKLSDALKGRSSKYPTILLAHQPWAAHQALDSFQDIDLILCGHTHGGQFFPMHIPIYFYNPFFAGLYNHKGKFVYVSSGTYFYGVPFRIGSTSELTLLTLVQ